MAKRQPKPKVMFVPLSATGYRTLWDAADPQNTVDALYNAGVPQGAASRLENIWFYDSDHMIRVKGEDRYEVESISSPGESEPVAKSGWINIPGLVQDGKFVDRAA